MRPMSRACPVPGAGPGALPARREAAPTQDSRPPAGRPQDPPAMNFSHRARLLVTATLGLVAACSSSSSSDPNVAGTVTQDLTVDPNGFVTSVQFEEAITFAGPGVFESDGGQTPLSVALDGTTAYVTWDERVHSQHRVRVVGIENVPVEWRQVVVQDERQPTVTITSATQDTSDLELGGDELVLTFTDGPRVAIEDAEDPTSWTITALGVPMDLGDSTFDLNEADQVLTITLGPSAHLHATFELIPTSVAAITGRMLATDTIQGVAVGDSTAPSLTSTVQNLAPLTGGDEFGRVIEFTFDEPMSPLFALTSTNFEVIDHVAAQGQTLVTRTELDALAPTVVRVTFSRPVVPGLDQVRVQLVRDAHGNLFPTQDLAPVPSSAIANGYESVAGVTLEGLGNDQIVVTLDQALDPDTADDPTLWSLTLGAPYGVIDLSTQTLSYELLDRELTIELDFDMVNGTTVDVECLGAGDVVGDDFTAAAAQVLASGDSSAPTVTDSGIVQRRDLDATGQTVDVRFSEAVDASSAENVAHYTFMPAVVVDTATVQADSAIVRLTLATPAVPGVHTLTIAAAIMDPAGNTLAAPYGPAALRTTDAVAPSVQFVTAQAVEGANNDRVLVLFDDGMYAAEVEDATNWNVESPIGTPIDVTTSTVTYDAGTLIATLVLATGAVQRGDDLAVELLAGRDLGGNALDVASATGVVTGENRRPTLESAWRLDVPFTNELVVRFSEPVDRLTDLYHPSTNPTGARFAVYTSGATLRGYPTGSTVLDDGLGVQLSFPFTVDLTDTLDVVGITDLAGNLMFPTLTRVIDAEDTQAPSQGSAPVLTAITGERNDTVAIEFAVPMASWRLTDAAQYTLQENGGGDVIDLTGSQFSYDGATTLTIVLSSTAAASLQAGTTYDLVLEVDAQNPLRTAQGVALAAPSSELGALVVGDITNGPTQGASRALLDPSDVNSILVVFDEAVTESAAETAAAYDYDSGNVAVSAELISPRVVRATFGVVIAAGDIVEVTTSAAVDLAGNAAGATLSLAVDDDQAAPVLTLVAGEIVEAAGYDFVRIRFSEMPDLATALTASSYTVVDSRGNLQVRGVSFNSSEIEVSLIVPDLLDGDSITVEVDGVTDVAGNLPGSPLSLGGVVGGDNVAPTLTNAYVNALLDTTGLVVDVELSEAVAVAFAGNVSNWSTTGSATVTAAEMVGADHVRLTLSVALGATEEIVVAAGLADLAGNAALSTQSIDPTE
jgi:hypothetical protein